MPKDTISQGIEIEAKFPGGNTEFEAIVAWLRNEGGFAVEPLRKIHRVHIYFDAGDLLKKAGCRLRCIIAPGEWVRYDFKADDPTGGRETLEFSQKATNPLQIANVVTNFCARLPNGGWSEALEASRDGMSICLAMTGTHVKAIASRNSLELELSWDVLSVIDSGKLLSEIEVELLSGSSEDFEICIRKLQSNLKLAPEPRSKLDRLMEK
ncbi:MAG: hypothetical protein AAF491_06320 [Verrucomicrobiota bacterium]